MTTPPPPNQPGQPGDRFGNQGAPVPPGPVSPDQQQPYPQNHPQQGYPAAPQAGFQGPVYGQPPAGGFAPVPGGSPYAPPTPARPNPIKKILMVALPLLAVIVIGAIVAVVFRDKDSGKTIDATPVGSCIVVTSGSILSVETEAIDCDDTSKLSYIVGAKLSSDDACKAADYDGSITETGTGAADDVLCLIANYQVDACYQQPQIGLGLNLEKASCSDVSSNLNVVFKVTDRVDSRTVPNCTGATRQVFAFDIETDPARELGVCAEILGDFTWK